MDELQLSDFDRRCNRLVKARERLIEDGNESPIADALRKHRQGEPLNEDEWVLTHFGFTRKECENGAPEMERRRILARNLKEG